MAFAIGSTVWATLKPFPPWPAKVVEPPKRILGERKSANQICVYFYGDKNFAFLRDKDLEDFEAMKQKYTKKPNKKISAAIEELYEPELQPEILELQHAQPAEADDAEEEQDDAQEQSEAEHKSDADEDAAPEKQTKKKEKKAKQDKKDHSDKKEKSSSSAPKQEVHKKESLSSPSATSTAARAPQHSVAPVPVTAKAMDTNGADSDDEMPKRKRKPASEGDSKKKARRSGGKQHKSAEFIADSSQESDGADAPDAEQQRQEEQRLERQRQRKEEKKKEKLLQKKMAKAQEALQPTLPDLVAQLRRALSTQATNVPGAVTVLTALAAFRVTPDMLTPDLVETLKKVRKYKDASVSQGASVVYDKWKSLFVQAPASSTDAAPPAAGATGETAVTLPAAAAPGDAHVGESAAPATASGAAPDADPVVAASVPETSTSS